MQSEVRQLASDLRVKIALAIVAASTLVAATSVPAARVSSSPPHAASDLVAIEPVSASVAVLPTVQVMPPTGSAIAMNVPPPVKTDSGEAPAASAEDVTTVRTRHPQRLSSASLCLAASSDPECEATFDAALRSTLAPADVVVTASGSAEVVGPRGAQPLHFQKHAPWVRRLETIGKEGIPFMRIPRGPDQEVVVGINRKGLLGVSLHERHQD